MIPLSYLSARQIKKKVADLDRAWSPVYRPRRLPPEPVKAQFTYFYLTPLPPVHHKEKTDEDRPLSRPSSIGSKRKSLSRLSDVESISSTASTPLPQFPERSPTEKTLLRRPTIYRAEPLKTDDELFAAFANMTQLKPLTFKRNADSYRFYRRYYPLILQKHEERKGSPSRRSRTPDSPMTVMIQRKLELNERLTELDAMMDNLEKTQPDDYPFKTELRSPIFNPTEWPWTKSDPAGMRRRYTMEAIFREIR